MRKVQYPPENVWQGFSSGKKREKDFYLSLLNNSGIKDSFLCFLACLKPEKVWRVLRICKCGMWLSRPLFMLSTSVFSPSR